MNKMQEEHNNGKERWLRIRKEERSSRDWLNSSLNKDRSPFNNKTKEKYSYWLNSNKKREHKLRGGKQNNIEEGNRG